LSNIQIVDAQFEENLKEEEQMNIEKMQLIANLFNELKEEGVYGFIHGKHEFQVNEAKLADEPNLQIASRESADFPYEIYVQFKGFKVFAILRPEQIKNYPQFREQAKADLKKQLEYLEEDIDLTGGEEYVTA
jgi:hypothetical protein